jgi:murein L,D-transpeptidase YafK
MLMALQKKFFQQVSGLVLILGAGFGLAGCEEESLAPNARASASISPATLAVMAEKGTSQNTPVLIRTYKKESELEIWKMKSDGRYALLKTYPMCRWSGQLGPKTREGDRQVPEGFYSITPSSMNPHSAYYLSFNVGYPNAYDRALGHDGGSIMVHGICSSRGCFSMTDPQIGEIYAIAREGFAGGQRAIQMQSYPFHMNAENLAKYRLDPNIAFWKQLKEGADNFEISKQEVLVGVCGKHYVFNATSADGSYFDPAGPCPALRRDPGVVSEVVAKQSRDDSKIAELISQGVKPVRTVYVDGGQHPFFGSHHESSVSRPEALAQAPVDLALDESQVNVELSRSKDKKTVPPLVQMASLKANPAIVSDVSAPVIPQQTEQKPESGKSAGSMFGNWFSSKPPEPQPPASQPVAISEPDVAVPANVPLPPRRLRGWAQPVKPGPAQKPAATAEAQVLKGALPVVSQNFSAVAQA